MSGRALCLVADCGHADEPDWTHHAPERAVPVLAHLRMLGEVAA